MTLRVPVGKPEGQEVRDCLDLGLQLLDFEAFNGSKLMLFEGNERTASVILYWNMGHGDCYRDDPHYDPMIFAAVARQGYRLLHYVGGEAIQLDDGTMREEVTVRILRTQE